MPNLHHLYAHFKRYGAKHRPLYAISFMMLFWAIFDGIVSFIAPVVITQMGISEAMMGIIIGSSSVAGIVFDLVLCRVLKNTNFRRVYLLMFAACAFYPLILWQAKTVWIYLIAMAVWGLYYDLFNIGAFDFVGRHTEKEEHTSSFGVMRAFNALGYMLAPLFAGILIAGTVGSKPFLLAWIFLGIAFAFYLLLVFMTKKAKVALEETAEKPISFLRELGLWKKITRFIFPVLALTFMLNVVDAFYWTVGPLISENLPSMDGFGSLFMVAYLLPPLLVGWAVGSVAARLGKKKTAFWSLLIGSAILISFYFIKSPIILVCVNFLSSFFMAMACPAISGAYADYIYESSQVEKEIETLEDSSTNLGFIIGPMLAGFMSQTFGHIQSFSIIGIAGVVIALVLLKVTPKEINVDVKRE